MIIGKPVLIWMLCRFQCTTIFFIFKWKRVMENGLFKLHFPQNGIAKEGRLKKWLSKKGWAWWVWLYDAVKTLLNFRIVRRTEAMNFQWFSAHLSLLLLKMSFHCALVSSRMIYALFIKPWNQTAMRAFEQFQYIICALQRKMPHFVNIILSSASWAIIFVDKLIFFSFSPSLSLGWTIEE